MKRADWKQDVLPEIWSGKNVADFIDPEIMEVSDSGVETLPSFYYA